MSLKFKKRQLPKRVGGGLLAGISADDISGGLNAMSTAMGGLNDQQLANSQFLQRNSSLRQLNNTNDAITQGADIAAGAASMIPGIGTAVGAGIKAVTALDSLVHDASTDEFGVYKSGLGKAASFLTPQGLIRNIAGPSQSELREQRENIRYQDVQSGNAQAQQAGAEVAFRTPKFQAPAYGSAV